MGIVEKMLIENPFSIGLQLLALVAYLPYAWLLPYVSLTQVAFYEIITGNLKANAAISDISSSEMNPEDEVR
jgi:hypothetical protein